MHKKPRPAFRRCERISKLCDKFSMTFANAMPVHERKQSHDVYPVNLGVEGGRRRRGGGGGGRGVGRGTGGGGRADSARPTLPPSPFSSPPPSGCTVNVS